MVVVVVVMVIVVVAAAAAVVVVVFLVVVLFVVFLLSSLFCVFAVYFVLPCTRHIPPFYASHTVHFVIFNTLASKCAQ